MTGRLVLDAVSVTVGGRAILDRASIEVPTGTWTAVIGPNGAGKSTMLRAVLGLTPSTGRITVDGEDVRRLGASARARLIAYVPQNPTMPSGFSVVDYIGFGRTAHLSPLQSPGAADRKIVDEAVERLDLLGFENRELGTLSGGERQRVVLARALAQRAAVLLLDEPTSALDLGHAQMVLELIDRMRREAGLTVLSCLHDLALAAGYAERMVLLAEGRVVAVGEPAEVLTSAALRKHYDARAEVVRDSRGLFIHPLRDAAPAEPPFPLPRPTLESWQDDEYARPALVWRPGRAWRMLSSGVHGGGLGDRSWWMNAQVSLKYDHHDPEAHTRAIAGGLGLGGLGVGMLTAADVTQWCGAEVEGVHAWATVGLGVPVRAARATAEGGHFHPGTINVLVVVPARLADAALVNLVITATEAKTQALAEAGVPGTGTASDSLCIAALTTEPTSAAFEGSAEHADFDDTRYGGPRSIWGSRVARAVHEAVAEGTAAWITRHGPPNPEPPPP